jgi:valyl-tRNA synthetase
MINIMNKDASLNEQAGPYAGLDRFDARAKLWADMEAADLTVRVEERIHQVGHCQRCNTVVEPLLSEQWWVKTTPLAEPSIAAVRNGDIQIIPQRFERVYYNWMENIRDWTISRQLWWGHRIPVWYGPDGQTFVARNAGEAQEQALAHYGEFVHLEQDPDVLDTWFSSGLWPFSTLGWPEQTDDLKTYYPTTVLETGYDIIFFWVARMIMLGLKCTGQVPFRYVYLHGMFRDEQGRKMSKSLGNALDPLDLISEYGADALRFSLLTGSTPGNDMKLSTQRVEGNRNFANKIWNAARFVIMNLEGRELPLTQDDDRFNISYQLPSREQLALADRWILSRLQAVQNEATRLIDSWQFGEAGRQLYEFLWNEYCDWYIEAAKVRLYEGTPTQAAATAQVLAYVLEHSLRLLHPYMPYVTETIWQNLPGLNVDGRALIISRWPHDSSLADDQADDAFGRLQEIVRAIRNVRSEYNVEPGRRIPAIFSAGENAALIERELPLLANLARLNSESVQVAAEVPALDKAVTIATGGVTIYVPLAGLVDLDAERNRLQKEIDNLAKLMERSQGLLANEGFVAKAPLEVIERERAKYEELRTRRQQLAERLTDL